MALYIAWFNFALRRHDPVDNAPILSAWLATAGEWRAVVVLLTTIIFGAFFYLLF